MDPFHHHEGPETPLFNFHVQGVPKPVLGTNLAVEKTATIVYRGYSAVAVVPPGVTVLRRERVEPSSLEKENVELRQEVRSLQCLLSEIRGICMDPPRIFGRSAFSKIAEISLRR